MNRITLIIIALVMAPGAYAQNASPTAPLVFACAVPWGSSYNCGGCSGPTWQVPNTALNVITSTSSFYQKLGSLPSSANVSVTTNSAISAGSTGSCKQITGTATAGSLLGAPPPPPPPPPNTGTSQLTWSAPTVNTDGSVLTNLQSFNVYRATCSACPCTSGLLVYKNVSSTVLTLTDPNLTVGTAYGYALTSVNSSGVESAQEGPVCLVITSGTQTVAPMPPGGLQVIQISSGST